MKYALSADFTILFFSTGRRDIFILNLNSGKAQTKRDADFNWQFIHGIILKWIVTSSWLELTEWLSVCLYELRRDTVIYRHRRFPWLSSFFPTYFQKSKLVWLATYDIHHTQMKFWKLNAALQPGLQNWFINYALQFIVSVRLRLSCIYCKRNGVFLPIEPTGQTLRSFQFYILIYSRPQFLLMRLTAFLNRLFSFRNGKKKKAKKIWKSTRQSGCKMKRCFLSFAFG